MEDFKVDDIVRASFGLTGRITGFTTKDSARMAVVYTGEGYSRAVEADSRLVKITECERPGCKNPPLDPTNRGWVCRWCWGKPWPVA
jgi:hypothetical protein